MIKKWLTRILGHEGGYVNNPNDPGGETKWGISKRSYPFLRISDLTIEDAVEIYKRDYLKPLKWDQYHDGVAYQLLDLAVHSGIRKAIKMIQETIHVEPDGIIGPITINRINQFSESDLIMLLIAKRIEFLTNLPTWNSFGKGWMRRIAVDLRYGAEDSD